MRLSLILISLMVLPAAFGLTCSINLVGVKETEGGYSGVLANLTVYAKPGSGNVFVQTMPLTEIDTQASARLAQEVSCELLNFNCKDLDLFYLVQSDYPMIGGPSAGAAMTACTLSVLLNKSLYSDVAITGTINPDGSVGPVGSVLEKSSVIKGFRSFLIPIDSAVQNALINGSLIKVDIPSYARDNFGLEVITVNDIIEVFKYLSGYEIVLKNVSSSEVAAQEYYEVMRIMAESLINQSKIFNFTDYPASLNGLINESNDLLTQANLLFNNGSYYSAASYAVRSLIPAYYAYNLLNYDNLTSAELLFNQTVDEINSFELNLSEINIDHIYDLESYAITIDRLNEAKELIDEAINKPLNEALYYLSFTKVRLLTAEQWFSLTDFFSSNKTVKLEQSSIKQLVIERLEQARNSITYARTLGDENLLLSAEDHIDKAYQAFNNEDYFYSLFESLKARAEANLVMEIRGLTNVSAKINSKENAALRAIARAEERGLLPFLSLSYLEYADTFKEEDPGQALSFLSYAVEFAGVSEAINNYLNFIPLVTGSPYTLLRIDDYSPITQILFLIVGFVAGLLITLVRYESD